jgi:hypothetical protein
MFSCLDFAYLCVHSTSRGLIISDGWSTDDASLQCTLINDGRHIIFVNYILILLSTSVENNWQEALGVLLRPLDVDRTCQRKRHRPRRTGPPLGWLCLRRSPPPNYSRIVLVRVLVKH